MKLTEDGFLILPKGKGGGGLRYDLRFIYENEGRIDEIKSLTKFKAPELLSTFNRVYLDVDRMLKEIELQLNYAKQKMDSVEAEIILDKAEDIIKSKGLKSSVDLRKAIVIRDKDYQDALEIKTQIEAASEYLRGKLKSFEMAYGSVRKIYGENAYNMRNTNINGISETEGEIGTERSPDLVTQFGRVR